MTVKLADNKLISDSVYSPTIKKLRMEKLILHLQTHCQQQKEPTLRRY